MIERWLNLYGLMMKVPPADEGDLILVVTNRNDGQSAIALEAETPKSVSRETPPEAT